MDAIFRALVDPSRRLLLDQLHRRDGQTLGDLCRYLPQMTRFGVMNHLRVLEDAGLLTTKKVGRAKHHYLNAATIRLVHDRWISKYTEALARTVADLKTSLEGGARMKPAHIHQTFIKCAPQAAWDAITDGALTRQYYYGTRVDSSWKNGAAITYFYPDGSVAVDGKILAITPPERLELTFHARWDEELEKEGPVRMVWLVEGGGDSDLTKVTVEYYDVAAGSHTMAAFTEGIAYIVAGMKTLLETGNRLAA